MSYSFHKFVRIGEIVVVVVLSIFALMTWLELTALRKAPVVLPNYQFESLNSADGTPMVVTRGTWIADNGPPEPLLTTAIECRKDRMECVESAALVVFVSGKGLLEAQQTVFGIDRWGEKEVVTKESAGPCGTRQILLNLSEKRALSKVSASDGHGKCRETPARTLELVTGYKVREALNR
ncbi:MAG TPA: hypothetical protein VFU92_07600 [Usitatibacter sp.]|nr:hypothetical protein [Usitatibacter sp.]